MSAEVIKLSHTQSTIKFIPDTVGVGATYRISLSDIGFTGQIVGSGGTVGLALTVVQGVDSLGIGTPRVNIKKVKWSSNTTTNGIKIVRGTTVIDNNYDQLLYQNEVEDTVIITNEFGTFLITDSDIDVLHLFQCGEMDTGAIAQKNTNDIVVTIDGSGTLIMDLAKVMGYESN